MVHAVDNFSCGYLHTIIVGEFVCRADISSICLQSLYVYRANSALKFFFLKSI